MLSKAISLGMSDTDDALKVTSFTLIITNVLIKTQGL